MTRHARFITIISSIMAVSIVLFTQASTAAAQPTIHGTLEIPAIGVNAPILDAPLGEKTWDVSHLDMTVGRLQHMPWFGMDENVLLAGHSADTQRQPDIFYNLHLLQTGDEISVRVGDHTYRYLVNTQFIVDQYDLSILQPTGHARLTLFTCDQSSYNSDTDTYDKRIVIYAYPVS